MTLTSHLDAFKSVAMDGSISDVSKFIHVDTDETQTQLYEFVQPFTDLHLTDYLAADIPWTDKVGYLRLNYASAVPQLVEGYNFPYWRADTASYPAPSFNAWGLEAQQTIFGEASRPLAVVITGRTSDFSLVIDGGTDPASRARTLLRSNAALVEFRLGAVRRSGSGSSGDWPFVRYGWLQGNGTKTQLGIFDMRGIRSPRDFTVSMQKPSAAVGVYIDIDPGGRNHGDLSLDYFRLTPA